MFNKLVLMVCMIMMCLFISISGYSAVNPDFTPQWQVGDSWDTVMRGMRMAELGIEDGDIEEPDEPLYIHFEVIDLKQIEGEMCYILEITYQEPVVEEALQLYVRKDDFTLKKVLEITKEPNGAVHIDNFYDNTHNFIIFLDPFRVSIPCDFPNFPATDTDEERTIKSHDFGLMTQKITFIDSNTMKVELSTENNNGLLKTTQIWEKGKPWWSSVKRTFTYKDITQPGHPEITRVENDNILEGTDTTPPDLNVSVSPATLWPPNHNMVEITPAITTSDDYDRFPEIKLYSVESNEPDDAPGAGDGHTTQDIQTDKVWDPKQHKMLDKILLRAERDGKGDGRIYTITYTATDFSGNTSTVSAIVTVPHDVGEKGNKN